MIELLDIRIDDRWIDYSNDGDICVTYNIEYNGKKYRRYAKIDFVGSIYSHAGNGEAECSLKPECEAQVRNFILTLPIETLKDHRNDWAINNKAATQ